MVDLNRTLSDKVSVGSFTLIMLFIISFFGWLIVRIENVETKVDKISVIETKVELIYQNTDWLKVEKEKYEKTNGKFNLEDFLGSIIYAVNE